jgi:hypothetical protein
MNPKLGPFGYCEAIMLGMNGKQTGEACGAAAAFMSRGHSCCWLHMQTDTSGPRAGKVVFGKVKK